MNAAERKEIDDGKGGRNRLAASNSPYLLQHASNPVDWHPWGKEAFEKARREDKPIFLSIGYSTCHWCHVMERESFENEEVAAILNENFVPVKVDREERPDLDAVYMTATQLLTGGGGWPNSVWITPEGKPWYAGTYFPPEDGFGRPGFKSLLKRLSTLWRTRRKEVEAQADRLADALRRTGAGGEPRPEAEVSRSLIGEAVSALRGSFDPRRGGFGGAPKFPPHNSLRLIFHEAGRGGDRELIGMATRTLDAMARGGIRDHLGGGFHRYATDAEWRVPHFEKMLYDNALLSRLYVDGYLATGDDRYREGAEEILDWVLRDMTDEGGGFHSALDADSEGEEGKFYLWDRDEVLSILGEEEGDLFSRAYGVEEGGTFTDPVTGQRPGNILYLKRAPLERAPDEAGGREGDALKARLGRARKRLLAEREKRSRPRLDDKVLADWNGLMIASLAYAGRTLEEPRYTAAAARAADFVLTKMRKEGRLLHAYRKGKTSGNAFLDDYAFLADGLLELHEATGRGRWLEEAKALVETMLVRYGDAKGGGFFFVPDDFVPDDHEVLLSRSKDPFDGPVPSGNGMAAKVLVDLFKRTGEARYLEAARSTLEAFSGFMARAPRGTESLILASALYLDAAPPPSGKTGAAARARKKPVTVELLAPRLEVAAGETLPLSVRFTVDGGWHVNSNRPLQDFLIPTTVEIEENRRASLAPFVYPEGKNFTPVFSPEPLSVYEGRTEIEIPLRVSDDASPGELPLKVHVSFQACNETSCVAPEALVLPLVLRVKGKE